MTATEKKSTPSETPEEKPVETKTIGKGAFAKIPREIEDEDLKHPAVGRLLLNERDRLLGEKTVLENYRDKYHEADRRAAVLEEKGKSEDKFKILYSFTLAIGGILIGGVFSIDNLAVQVVLGLLGVVIIVVSIYMAFK